MAEVTIRNRFDASDEPLATEVLKAGVVSGLLGGVFMAVWGMFATLAYGLGPLAVPPLIGAVFRGPEALIEGPGIIVIGVVVHLLTSAGFGVLFATLVRRDTPPGISTLAGVAFSLGIFVLMMFVVVPVVDPVMANRMALMIGTMLIMHVLYGLGLGLAPMFRRRFTRRPVQVLTPTRITMRPS